MITRGTTPTIRFTFTEIDVSNITTAYLTIEQQTEMLVEKTIEDATIGENYLEWTLSQNETIKFKNKWNVRIQCRYKLVDGNAYASQIYELKPYDILKEDVI